MKEDPSIRQFQKMMATEEGKQLLHLLTRDGGATLKQAGADLKQGNEAGAKDRLAPLLGQTEVQKLLQSLNRTMGHG